MILSFTVSEVFTNPIHFLWLNTKQKYYSLSFVVCRLLVKATLSYTFTERLFSIKEEYSMCLWNVLVLELLITARKSWRERRKNQCKNLVSKNYLIQCLDIHLSCIFTSCSMECHLKSIM